MKKKTKIILSISAAVAMLFVLVGLMSGSCGAADDMEPEGGVESEAKTMETLPDRSSARRRSGPPSRRTSSSNVAESPADEEEGEDDDDEESESTEEDKRADEEEDMVNAFDELTDKWNEPSERNITMDDVRSFAEMFRKIPDSRKDECLHRALNLVPDDNVMLLVGILMDKTLDSEFIEMVYNDVLNRSEAVKTPILQQIFKDKTHPCWADTAWIFDVTGEKNAGGRESETK